MKNLIAQLLITLAEKEEESKKLTIRQMKQARRLTVTTEVESTLTDLMHGPLVNDGDRELLYWHIEKILHSSYR